MFPLKIRKLTYSAQYHIEHGKGIGADYDANYVELYAPFNGNCSLNWGPEGGWWWKVTRENGDRIECAHLSQGNIKTGPVKMGQLVAITGNTGALTSGPHLHIQIFNKAGQRIDPEKYDWYMFKPNSIVFSKKDAEYYWVKQDGTLLFIPHDRLTQAACMALAAPTEDSLKGQTAGNF
jgi:murein DD-endopeptidase MepM/ murein hydrolase activator NlpD